MEYFAILFVLRIDLVFIACDDLRSAPIVSYLDVVNSQCYDHWCHFSIDIVGLPSLVFFFKHFFDL